MRVRWTFAAKNDLVGIEDFYMDKDPAVSRRIARRILVAVRLLQATPNIGRPGRVPGTRELIVPRTRYLIPYAVARGEVHLLRVLHSSMEWPEPLD